MLELQELATIENVAFADVISAAFGKKKTILRDFISKELDVDADIHKEARATRKVFEEPEPVDTMDKTDSAVDEWEEF